MDKDDRHETGQNANIQSSTTRIQEIEAQIADLKKRWPAHSIPPGMMQRLDELEEELEHLLKSFQICKASHKQPPFHSPKR